MFKFMPTSQVEDCLDDVSELCVKKWMHSTSAGWWPQLCLIVPAWTIFILEKMKKCLWAATSNDKNTMQTVQEEKKY